MALFGRRRRAETQDSPLGGPWIVGRRATERSAERARGTPLLALLECARAPAEIWGVRRVAPAAPGLLFTLYASLFPCLTNQKSSQATQTELLRCVEVNVPSVLTPPAKRLQTSTVRHLWLLAGRVVWCAPTPCSYSLSCRRCSPSPASAKTRAAMALERSTSRATTGVQALRSASVSMAPTVTIVADENIHHRHCHHCHRRHRRHLGSRRKWQARLAGSSTR